MRIVTPLIVLCIFFSQKSYAQINSSFNTSVVKGCSPLTVSYTNTSSSSTTSWNWNFGNGNTSVLENPSAVYINPGQYIVSLTTSDGINTNTSFDTVKVLANPVVDFEASQTLGCSDLDVSLTNLSITETGIATVFWDFGDGNTSTAINPTHTFGEGVFNITTIVTDSTGCTTQKEKLNYIQSVGSPIAAFSATNTQNCIAPNTVTFTNNTSNNINAAYTWSFGDGNTSNIANPTHTYSSFGSYDVTLAVSANTCTDTLTNNNFIEINPLEADFTSNHTTRCVGDAIMFSNTSNITANSFSWDFGDGSTPKTQENPSHVYTSPGVYTISFSINKGNCNDTEVKTSYITILEKPIVEFYSDSSESCSIPFLVNFNSATTNNNDTYLWSFGDGTSSNQINPSNVYNMNGSFNVSLKITNSGGCSGLKIKNSFIQITSPKASINIDSAYGCAPKTIEIEDLSTGVNGINTWIWDFGDGHTQVGPNQPTHTYVDTGVFMVSLVIIDNKGCSDTLNPLAPVEVGQKLNIDFAASESVTCLSQPIEFTNLSNTATTGNVTWNWDFGDGNTAQSFDTLYEYTDFGDFDVSLSASHYGCINTITKGDLLTINPPAANMETEVNCDNYLELFFRDASEESDVWTWVINGDSINTQNTNYIFPDSGIYTATIYIENTTYQCIDSSSKNIKVQIPNSGFFSQNTTGCSPLSAEFIDTSFLSVSHLWNFGDGSTSRFKSLSHIYSDIGMYDVSLIVENIYGCQDTIIQENLITVLGVNTDFEAQDTFGCSPLLVNFSDLSTTSVSTGTISSWFWDFGDGNTSTLQHPVHTYNEVGLFTVSLTTISSDGCSNTSFKNNYIRSSGPITDISYNDISCIDTELEFSNNSISLGCSIQTYLWNFGDGNTSNDASPSHTYTQAGQYDIALYMEDHSGCDTTLIIPQAITIDSIAVDFVADSLVGECTGFIVNFEELVSPSPISWSWNFGNGNTSTLANPSTIFSSIGTFDVTLIAENNSGCIDSITKTNYITVNGPTGVLQTSTDSGCIDLDVNFNIITDNSISQIWDFGDGTVVGNNLTNYTHTYTDVSTFHPLVILQDESGCTVPYYFDTIRTSNINANFGLSDTYLCTPEEIVFTDSSCATHPIISWSWSFGDNKNSELQNPTHQYTQGGVFDVNLTVDNAFCKDTKTISVVSDASTNAAFTYTTPAALCPPVSMPFTNITSSDSTISAQVWTFSNGITSTQTNPGEIEFTESGTYYVNLEITTEKNCSNSFTDTIVINERPELSFDLDTIVLCYGSDTLLPAVHPEAYVTWNTEKYLSCNDCPDPIIEGVEDQTYYVNATNEFGCTYADTLQVIVKSIPEITVSEDEKVLKGTEVNLSVFSPGNSKFSWTPAEDLSCADCNATSFTANENTEFTVSVSDDFGCSNQATVFVEIFDMCAGGFLMFPNIFTPNFDNKNDVFKAISQNNLEPEINHYRIYDRWGKVVFQADDLDSGWDGTHNGQEQRNGVYVYVVDVVCTDGSTQIFNGNVTLMR